MAHRRCEHAFWAWFFTDQFAEVSIPLNRASISTSIAGIVIALSNQITSMSRQAEFGARP
jgi:hypothetical protein